ncbi:hypothetical protein CspHIS471_0505760 [Cutaneotrichosporon sp. HIS471]|nr:hypothetical protein CspHIS471_0505760 [Cutaneotrichosporon sp. HIS471]
MRALTFLFVITSAAATIPIPETTCSPIHVLLDSAAAVFGLHLNLCVPQEEHHAYQDPGYYPDGVDLDELNFGDFEPLPDFHDAEYAQMV